jgi:hypothetical protein
MLTPQVTEFLAGAMTFLCQNSIKTSSTKIQSLVQRVRVAISPGPKMLELEANCSYLSSKKAKIKYLVEVKVTVW